ncbi:unnamed protein product [Prorocentrum cordatum]|uniref:Uncharacterized protein n=1 Tax=Prorocentrum cordatum TaxID=2364126 RepID=A0ABN9SGV7_9DINO|nr:unnamed protein product [Polarella glacialis]
MPVGRPLDLCRPPPKGTAVLHPVPDNARSAAHACARLHLEHVCVPSTLEFEWQGGCGPPLYWSYGGRPRCPVTPVLLLPLLLLSLLLMASSRQSSGNCCLGAVLPSSVVTVVLSLAQLHPTSGEQVCIRRLRSRRSGTDTYLSEFRADSSDRGEGWRSIMHHHEAAIFDTTILP